jgi:hypothetical protein
MRNHRGKVTLSCKRLSGEITQKKSIDPLGGDTTIRQGSAASLCTQAHNSLGKSPEVGDADSDDRYASHNREI